MSNSKTSTTATSLSWAHTVDSTANLLVVAIANGVYTNTGGTVQYDPNATVTFTPSGGSPVTLTKLQRVNTTANNGHDRAVSLFYAVNPPPGAGTILFSAPKPAAGQQNGIAILGTSISMIGANTSNPIGTAASVASSTDVTTESVTTSSPASAIVIGVASARSTTAPTVASGETVQQNAAANTNTYGTITTQPGGANQTTSTTMTTADQIALLVVPILSA